MPGRRELMGYAACALFTACGWDASGVRQNVTGWGGTGWGGTGWGGGGSGWNVEAGFGSDLSQELAFVTEPTFVGNENPAAPQVGVLRLETNVAAEAEVTVSGGGEEWSLRLPAATQFMKPILGLLPATAYAVTVRVAVGESRLAAGPLEWTTPPLPTWLPPIQVPISEPSLMEPGMTLFNARVGWEVEPSPMVIVDHEGSVRWYYSGAPVQDDNRRLANGNFLFTADNCVLREVDVLGNAVRSWHATGYPMPCEAPSDSIPVAIDSFHHELSMLPNGSLLVLSTEARMIDGFPTSEDDPDAPTETALVMGCVIVEFTPAGEILKYIPLMDLLDPTRIGRGSISTGWRVLYDYSRDGMMARDWDHANAVIYDEASDSYYVSVRHQDAVIKVNRSDQTLTWILGTPSNWEEPWASKLLSPLGELKWQYHQHAMELTPHGLGLYDNGNFRASAYETPVAQYSRAVLFSIDEEAMTVSELWSYGSSSGPDSFYSSGMGDADWQPATGNVLIVNGLLQGERAVYAQVLEVLPNGRRVFQLEVGGTEAGSVYTIHRAQRLADIRR